LPPGARLASRSTAINPAEEPLPSTMSTKKIITTLIAVLISAFFLYLAFRNIDLGELREAFATINWLWAIPFLGVTWLTFVWRAVRWKRLLAETKEVGTWECYGPMMVGFAFNSVFPLRVGEVARPLALKKKCGVPMFAGLSTVFVERVFDILALLAFFVFCLFFIRFDDNFLLEYQGFTVTPEVMNAIIKNITIGAVVLFIGSVLMLTEWFRNIVLRIVRWTPILPAGFKEKIAALFETFAKGFNALRKPSRVALISLDTFMIWFLTGATFWVMAWGFPGIELSLIHALIFLVITCLLISIPAAPGYWGPYELGGILALILTEVVVNTSAGQATALSFTLTVHFLQWALVTVIGLYYAGKIHVSVKEAAEVEDTPQEPAR